MKSRPGATPKEGVFEFSVLEAVGRDFHHPGPRKTLPQRSPIYDLHSLPSVGDGSHQTSQMCDVAVRDGWRDPLVLFLYLVAWVPTMGKSRTSLLFVLLFLVVTREAEASRCGLFLTSPCSTPRQVASPAPESHVEGPGRSSLSL